MIRSFAAVPLFALLALVGCSAPVESEEQTPQTTVEESELTTTAKSPVLPGSKLDKKLAADWWRWAMAIPAASHPLADLSDCSTNQSGKVWFLGGGFASGSYQRTCTIPHGRSIYFPVMNFSYNNYLEDPQKTDAELHELASFWGSALTEASAEIDGVAVPHMKKHHVHSDVFTFSWPNAPVFDPSALAGSTNMVTDGTYLHVGPLCRGKHTIHFKAKAVFTQEKFGFDDTFELDVTYRIIVD
jgi:hypothetical protein